MSNAGEPKALLFGKALSIFSYFLLCAFVGAAVVLTPTPLASLMLVFFCSVIFILGDSYISHVKFCDFFSWF